MKRSRIIPIIFVLTLGIGLLPVSGVSGYTPRPGDHFSYTETIDVGNGQGYYGGYSDHTDTTGSEMMNTVFSNKTVASYYSFSWNFHDNSGITKNGGSAGNFTWSSLSFQYVHGTDNQTGYVNPNVWFYVDNSTPKGGSFTLLDTLMTVQSRNYGFYLTSESRYVNTIFAQGSAGYARHDDYGNYSAAYTWSAYFDPQTGYIVGYVWDEHDSNNVGDSFTYTEKLSVSATSYPLSAGTAPPSFLVSLLPLIAILVVLIIVIVIVAVLFSRRRRRVKLPKHAYEQQYRPPQPYPVPAPGIDLTPKQPPVQQIVIKEVVKVKCKYCGALIDSTVQTCPICGAPRT